MMVREKRGGYARWWKIARLTAVAIWVAACSGVDDLPGIADDRRPLGEGEQCRISLSIGALSDYKVAKTRGEAPKADVVLDYTHKPIGKGPSGKELDMKMLVQRSVGAETRASYENPVDSVLGAGSLMRMLVFAGEYGTEQVNMDTPVYNYVFRIDPNGMTATFIDPLAELTLPKGDYRFLCFPADDRYNGWKVGVSAKATGCNMMPVEKGRDFVCLATEVISLSTVAYKLDLSDFTRVGYKLNLVFVNESGGGLETSSTPGTAGAFSLTIGDDGTTEHIINSEAKINLKDKRLSAYSGHLVSGEVKTQGTGTNQTYTGFSYYMIANDMAVQKLTITYPTFVVDFGTNKLVLSGATYTSESRMRFRSGYDYTVTFGIGEFTSKPELIPWIQVGGVKWAKGNLGFEMGKGCYLASTPDQVTGETAGRMVAGSYYRWMCPYPQELLDSPNLNPVTSKTWDIPYVPPYWEGVEVNRWGNFDSFYSQYTVKPEDNPFPGGVNERSVEDPCFGLQTVLGGNWRMPTYNELYLLLYVSPTSIPSGRFSSVTRNRYAKFSSPVDIAVLRTFRGVEESDKWNGIYFPASASPNENPEILHGGANPEEWYNPEKMLFIPAVGVLDGTEQLIYYRAAFRVWSSTPARNSMNANLFEAAGDGTDYGALISLCPYNVSNSVRCVLDE